MMYFINAFKEIIESTWKSIWIVIMHKRALSKYIKSPNLNSPTSEREAVSFYFANFYPTKVVGRGPRTTTRNLAMLCISQFHLRPNPPSPPPPSAPSAGLLELSMWINVIWLLNQISVDIIWWTSFRIYKTIHNIYKRYSALLILMLIMNFISILKP